MRETGLGQEVLLFAKRNTKATCNGQCRNSRNGDESDEDLDLKGKPMCF